MFTLPLTCVLLLQTSEFNCIDMANTMYAFVAMNAAPGLQALDAMAQHLNTHYSDYGSVEMTQMLYGFSQLSFHPGAVVGRVVVAFNRQPQLFDANSKRLLSYALPSLEGNNPTLGVLNSKDVSDESDMATGDEDVREADRTFSTAAAQ
jgi:hypothetical protein